MSQLIDAWLPIAFAVNSLNRSMGQPDLYPFVLSSPAIWKLAFVHERIHAIEPSAQVSEHNALRAIISGLKRAVGSPQSTE